MTVTKRRTKTEAENAENAGLATEPGIKYTCDFCAVDITATVRIKCAAKECEEVDLCPICFSEGREPQHHKAWHDYKVVEKHSKPIFTEDWGADEELLLITGLQTYGLGNWADVAEQVGTRTKDDCERHYIETYLRERPVGKREFLPRMKAKIEISQEEFSARKKRRIEQMRKPHPLPASALQATGSQPSNHEVAGFMPGRLEFDTEVENEAEMIIKDMEFGLVMGYGGADQPEPPPTESSKEQSTNVKVATQGDKTSMDPIEKADPPQKEELTVVKQEGESERTVDAMDVDVDSHAKPPETPTKLKDRDADNSEDEAESKPPKLIFEIEEPDDVELKLTMLEIYYEKLNARTAAKDLIFDRGLMEFKKNAAAEKKRPKEEREIFNRYKVFAKLQTAEDFEVLVDGLIYEHMIRRRITELQEYRRQGITTAVDAARYDTVKVQRTGGYKHTVAREPMSNSDRMLQRGVVGRYPGNATPIPETVFRRNGHLLNGDRTREGTPKLPKLPETFKPVLPTSLAAASSLDLLSRSEQALCAHLQILPKPYLVIKDTLVRESARRGGMLLRKEARKLLRIDGAKVGKIYDFLKNNGMLMVRRPVETETAETALNGDANQPAAEIAAAIPPANGVSL